MTEDKLQEIERALDILASVGSGDALFSYRGTELRHSHVRGLIAEVRRLRGKELIRCKVSYKDGGLELTPVDLEHPPDNAQAKSP